MMLHYIILYHIKLYYFPFINSLLCARQCGSCFTYVIPFGPQRHSDRWSVILCPSPVRKLRALRRQIVSPGYSGCALQWHAVVLLGSLCPPLALASTPSLCPSLHLDVTTVGQMLTEETASHVPQVPFGLGHVRSGPSLRVRDIPVEPQTKAPFDFSVSPQRRGGERLALNFSHVFSYLAFLADSPSFEMRPRPRSQATG